MSEAAEGSVVERRGSLWATVKAVGWSFVGLRKRSDLEHDVARLNPVHIIVVGFAGVFVFVVGLIALVNWVVAK
jgi:hypothetical protein